MLNEELPKVCKWFQNNKLSLDTKKTFFQIYNNSKTDANININQEGSTIREAEKVKYLGVYIDRDMKWTSHIKHIASTICRNIGIINRSKYFLNSKHRQMTLVV